MLTNDQMRPNRYAHWAMARKKLAWITEQLQSGNTVYICTAYKVTKCSLKHLSMFRASRNGLFIQSGKQWLCIDYANLRASK